MTRTQHTEEQNAGDVTNVVRGPEDAGYRNDNQREYKEPLNDSYHPKSESASYRKPPEVTAYDMGKPDYKTLETAEPINTGAGDDSFSPRQSEQPRTPEPVERMEAPRNTEDVTRTQHTGEQNAGDVTNVVRGPEDAGYRNDNQREYKEPLNDSYHPKSESAS